MRDTGIIRRIDDLGRVSIPKEIRKTLRVTEGTPLEIYLEKNMLIFKKYSPAKNDNGEIYGVMNSLNELLNKPCVLTDTDQIIYICGGQKYKEIIGKKISQELEKTLKEKKNISLAKKDGVIIPLVKNDSLKIENEIIIPIMVDRDCYGSLILFDEDANKRFSACDIRTAQLSAMIISKNFEQC